MCVLLNSLSLSFFILPQLQVSVLTDQVEAQGEKIRDLEVCLEGHQLKLNATEEMLQQVGMWNCSGTSEARPSVYQVYWVNK